MRDNILKSASALGACERLDKVKNFHSLTSLFFTPQGLEFCHKNNFPPLGIFQAHKNEVSDCNMYVDCGCIRLDKRKYICLVGNTSAEIEASGVDFVHTVILMHGASATINASNYAVIKVVNISGSKVEINKDKTVIVL